MIKLANSFPVSGDVFCLSWSKDCANNLITGTIIEVIWNNKNSDQCDLCTILLSNGIKKLAGAYWFVVDINRCGSVK